jgi:hypothetical protein
MVRCETKDDTAWMGEREEKISTKTKDTEDVEVSLRRKSRYE